MKIKYVISLIIILLVSVSCSKAGQSQKMSDNAGAEHLPIQIVAAQSIGETKKLVSTEVSTLQPTEKIGPDTGTKRYEIKHKASDKKYWITITKDLDFKYKLTLYDDSVELQTFDIVISDLTDMKQIDLNSDGYTDLIFGSNKSPDKQKAYQRAYLWNPSLQQYTEIKYSGFDKLINFRIKNGYIINLMQQADNLLILQFLVFDGGALKKVKEYYEVQPQKDGEMYWVSINEDDKGNSMLTLSDLKFHVLQSIPVDDLYFTFPNMEFEDLNGDGYADAVITIGGTWNEKHAVFLWDSTAKAYTKVVFEGFDMLASFEVKDGYIENFIRGDDPDDSGKEKLVFDGNILKKVEE